LAEITPVTATNAEVGAGWSGPAEARVTAADFRAASSSMQRLELGALVDAYFSFSRSKSIRCIFMFIEAT
jgi:predicted secreted protein